MTTGLRPVRGPSAMTAEPDPRTSTDARAPHEAAAQQPRPEGEGRDASGEERATRSPIPLALVAIEVAALMLPKRYRSRYDREFLAELYEMDSREQLKFAACVLGQAWHLRAVLRDRPPIEDEDAER